MLSFDEKRKQIGEWLKEPDGSKLWDLMCGLRGPDSPSERSNMGAEERNAAYKGRRERKRETVEVIREKAFFGVIGGAARHHDADKVVLPPQGEWDHFDRHVKRAAGVLGLEVEIAGSLAGKNAFKVEVKEGKLKEGKEMKEKSDLVAKVIQAHSDASLNGTCGCWSCVAISLGVDESKVEEIYIAQGWLDLPGEEEEEFDDPDD